MNKLVIQIVFAFVLSIPLQVRSQEHQLVKLWETDTVLRTPESAYPHKKSNTIYVSNIEGEPWGKDGVGSVVKVSFDGKLIKDNWITGLNAPKGMGLHGNLLYVADLSQLVIIDIAKGVVKNKVEIKGAGGLNDVSVDANGVVYVTDSKNKKLFRFDKGRYTEMLDSNQLKGPNGILWLREGLFIADAGSLYKVEKNKKLKLIASGMEPSTDGIVSLGNGEFIVSCWIGTIYYIKKDGSKQLLLDTREEKMNTADIGYDPTSKTLYVPTFFKNKLIAYRVK